MPAQRSGGELAPEPAVPELQVAVLSPHRLTFEQHDPHVGRTNLGGEKGQAIVVEGAEEIVGELFALDCDQLRMGGRDQEVGPVILRGGGGGAEILERGWLSGRNEDQF